MKIATLRRTAGALALAAGLGACAHGAEAPRDTSPAPSGESTPVRVTNNNWNDMNVYALRGGMRYRLGSVTSMSTRTLELPADVADAGRSVRLLLDPVGSRLSHRTGPILVEPHQWIDVTVQNNLATSSYSVRGQ